MLRPLYRGFIDLLHIAVSKKLSTSTENQYLYMYILAPRPKTDIYIKFKYLIYAQSVKLRFIL